jgi:hypothetical protein
MNSNTETQQTNTRVVKGSFYSLIDRLQICMQKKYPERGIWDEDTYYDIAFQWMGKEYELEKRVKELEKKWGN